MWDYLCSLDKLRKHQQVIIFTFWVASPTLDQVVTNGQIYLNIMYVYLWISLSILASRSRICFFPKHQVTDLQLVIRLMVSFINEYVCFWIRLDDRHKTITRWVPLATPGSPSSSHDMFCYFQFTLIINIKLYIQFEFKMGPSGNTWITTIFPFPFKKAANGTFATQSSYTQEIHLKVFIVSRLWSGNKNFDVRHFGISGGWPWLLWSSFIVFFAVLRSKWVTIYIHISYVFHMLEWGHIGWLEC